ncbi:hypothetical protein [Geodermatophilus sp. FMUSA9-8]|uniref:hypothetical protein n=1 Tax=Geodermatophilus sp. FMUSA9-8 TaxID=3120155 RepID=UPI0030089B27
MRRVTVALSGALLGLCAQGVYSGTAMADPVACQQYNSLGICVVEAESAQQPGSRPVAVDSGSGGGSQEAPCTLDTTGAPIPCQDGPSWWVQSLQCYAQPMLEPPPKDSPVWGGRTDGAIYLCSFYSDGGAFPGTNGFTFWSATAPAGPAAVDPAALAEQALRTLTIPEPTTGRYPAGTLRDGRPYTVVNAYTWFWTDPASFRALTARADAGGVWAEVTVTPAALSFTPGDGADAVSCPGPGVAWQRGGGVWAPSPTGCQYRYPHSSIHQPDEQVTATYGISWSVAWTSSTGASGTLPDLTTTSNATFAVAEVQAVVTG